MKRIQQGFTLIELMIVIAIVGILAAIALPAYQDYTVRAKVSEGLAKAAEAKTTIAEFFVTNARMPADLDEAGLAATVDTDIVYTLEWDSTGFLTVNLQAIGGSVVQGDDFILSIADTNEGVIQWTCKAGTLKNKYLPASCR